MPPNNVVIIHAENCPLCEMAIKRYRKAGVEPRLFLGHFEIWEVDKDLATDVLAAMAMADVDLDSYALPMVFEDGLLVKGES